MIGWNPTPEQTYVFYASRLSGASPVASLLVGVAAMHASVRGRWFGSAADIGMHCRIGDQAALESGLQELEMRRIITRWRGKDVDGDHEIQVLGLVDYRKIPGHIEGRRFPSKIAASPRKFPDPPQFQTSPGEGGEGEASSGPPVNGWGATRSPDAVSRQTDREIERKRDSSSFRAREAPGPMTLPEWLAPSVTRIQPWLDVARLSQPDGDVRASAMAHYLAAIDFVNPQQCMVTPDMLAEFANGMPAERFRLVVQSTLAIEKKTRDGRPAALCHQPWNWLNEQARQAVEAEKRPKRSRKRVDQPAPMSEGDIRKQDEEARARLEREFGLTPS